MNFISRRNEPHFLRYCSNLVKGLNLNLTTTKRYATFISRNPALQSHFLTVTIIMSERPLKRQCQWAKNLEYEDRAEMLNAQGIAAMGLLEMELQVQQNQAKIDGSWTLKAIGEMRRLKDQGMMPDTLKMIEHVDEESAKIFRNGRAAPKLAEENSKEIKRLEDLVKDLRRENQTLELQKTNTEKESNRVRELERVNKDLQGKVRRLDRSKEMDEDRITKLERLNKTLEDENRRLNHDKSSKSKQLARLEELDGAKTRLEKENSDLAKKIVRVELECSTLKEDKWSTEEAHREEIGRQKTMVKEAVEERDKFIRAGKSMAFKLNTTVQSNEDCKAEVEKLQASLKETKTQAAEAQKTFEWQLRNDEEKYKSLQQDINGMDESRKQISQLQVEKATLKGHLEAQRLENTQRHKDCLILQKDNGALESREKSLKQELADAKGELEERNVTLQNQITVNNDHFQQLRKMSSDCSERVTGLQDLHENQKKDLEGMFTQEKMTHKEKMGSARKDLRRAEDQLKSTQTELEDASKRLVDADACVRTTQEHLEDARGKLKDTGEQLEDMENQRNDERTCVDDLQKKFDDLKLQVVQGLSHTKQELVERESNARRIFAQLREDIRVEQDRSEDLEIAIDNMDQELDESVDTWNQANERARRFEEGLIAMTADYEEAEDQVASLTEDIDEVRESLHDATRSITDAEKTLELERGRVAETKELLWELYLGVPGSPKNLDRWGIKMSSGVFMLRIPRVVIDFESMYIAGYRPPPAQFDMKDAAMEWIRCLASFEDTQGESGNTFPIIVKYWAIVGDLVVLPAPQRRKVFQGVYHFACRLLEQSSRMTDVEAWVLFQLHATLLDVGWNAISGDASRLLQQAEASSMGELARIGLIAWQRQQQQHSLYEYGIGTASIFQRVQCWRRGVGSAWEVSIEILSEGLLLVAREVRSDKTAARCSVVFDPRSCLEVFSARDRRMVLQLSGDSLGGICFASCEPVEQTELWTWAAGFRIGIPEDFCWWYGQ